MLVSELITALQSHDGTLPVCVLEQDGIMYFTGLDNIEVVEGKLYLGASNRIAQVIAYLILQKEETQAQVDFHSQATIEQQAILDTLNAL